MKKSKYAVGLVYTKNLGGSTNITQILHITTADSEESAIGIAIVHNRDNESIKEHGLQIISCIKIK